MIGLILACVLSGDVCFKTISNEYPKVVSISDNKVVIALGPDRVKEFCSCTQCAKGVPCGTQIEKIDPVPVNQKPVQAIKQEEPVEVPTFFQGQYCPDCQRYKKWR